MSLIHSALKKAEGEKGTSKLPPPPFQDSSTKPPSLQKEGKKYGKFLRWGVLLLGVGIGFFWIQKNLFVEKKPAVPPVVFLPEEKPLKPVETVESPSPPEIEEAPVPPVSTPPSPSILLKSSILLNGIVQGEGEPFAVLNNQIFRVGDEIEGAVLLKIGRDFVVLKENGEEFQIKMK